LATSAVFTFLPLFVQEAQGWSAGAAGWLLAGIGLVGVASRIAWGPIAERRLGHGRVLWILSIESTIAALVLAWAASSPVSPWLLIFAALLFGIGAVAWNSVGMLAVMDLSPEGGVGRGTGVVLLGFLLGFGFGAPLMGLSVDASGTYSPGWLVVAALFASGSIMARRVRAASTLAVP
jgi:predicted MFS family arabinose efflux permease